MKKTNLLDTINTPTISNDQFLQAFDEYTTVSNAYHAIESSIYFIVQLMKKHDAGQITLTEDDKKTLMNSYSYLVELVDAYDD